VAGPGAGAAVGVEEEEVTISLHNQVKKKDIVHTMSI
jgi:hypothetical protein